MEFPLPLRTAIEQKAQDSSTAELIREAQGLSQRYREESGQGKRLVTTDRQAFVYAAVRMPATFGAVAAALEHTLPFLEDAPTSLLDVGAGTGAACPQAANRCKKPAGFRAISPTKIRSLPAPDW